MDKLSFKEFNPQLLAENSTVTGTAAAMVEPNVMLSIANIAKNGKASNTFEYVMLARMLQYLKLGILYKQSNPWEVNITTSPELLALLKTMPDKDVAQVAQRMHEVLTTKNRDDLYYLVNPAQEYLTWLKWVHSREADD